MVGKSDWAATHCIDLRAKGIGFVPAMEGMGVISKAVAAEPSRESHTQDRETLLLGHPRLWRLVSNGNNQHEGILPSTMMIRGSLLVRRHRG